MRPVLVSLVIAAYAMHMALGCCVAHEHHECAACDHDSQAAEGHGHSHSHSHGHEHEDCCQPSDSPGHHAPDHEHPCHKQSCVATLGVKVQATGGELSAALPQLALGTALAGTLSAATTVERMNERCDVAPPVRAHLAKLVLTI